MKIDEQTRVYLAGCGGMLGEAVYGIFNSIAKVKATDIDANEQWLTYADVRDYYDISKSIKEFNPDVVINLAAITDMELCERDQANAWLTNALGAENIGLTANELNIPYVYISTAGIFDGRKDVFNDFDEPNPLSCYANSKYAGEMFVKQHVRKYFVIRAGWMMGGGPRKDKKFINKIYKQIISGAKTLNVVDDKMGTPTYTVDFANGLKKIIESDMYSVYNQVCGGSCSRYEVATEFIRLIGFDKKVKINRVSSDYFKDEYFAPRPSSEKLVNMKLAARSLDIMRDWKICLAEYSHEFVKDLMMRGL